MAEKPHLLPRDGSAPGASEQTAMVLQISKRSADRGWQSAKAWLYRELAAHSRDEETS